MEKLNLGMPRILLAGLVLLLTMTSGMAFVPFKRLVPSEFEATLELGGIRQHVLIRGKPGAPLLVIVHGGPGVNENPLFRQYLPQLESDYQVVYWEQRGTGRSLPSNLPRQTLNISQFESDLSDLVSFLVKKYHQERVYVLAHSWGTIPASLYVRKHPERVLAYVAVAPMLDVPTSEREGWAWALETAKQQKNEKAISALEDIGPPPHDVDAMLKSRKWVERFGGTFHQSMRTKNLLFTALKDDKTTINDIVLFGRGNHVSLDVLWPDIRDFQLPEAGQWEVPVAFIVGDYDHVTSPKVARHYYEVMQAPCKIWVGFSGSAHNPPFEEPAQFARFMGEALPQWATSCSDEKLAIKK